MFGTSLPNIYLFSKNKKNFDFPNFQQLRNKYPKYTFGCLFCNNNPMVDITNNLSQVGSSILNNFNKYGINNNKKLIFSSTRSFVNYFVPNMNES
jgi:hypothetical protein